MGRALAREHSGDTEGAIALYRRIVLENPLNAEAHFNLALLLHDTQQAYVEAIYHYGVFLRLRPDADKVGIVRDRMQKAERLLRVRLADRVPPEGLDGLDAHAATQIRQMQEQLRVQQAARRALEDRVAAAERQVLMLEQANQALEQQNARLAHRLSAALTPDPRTAPPADSTAIGRSVPVPGAREPRTYEVRPGDSLSRIAAQVYGDPLLWRRIRDANPDKVDAQDRVRAGQILTIP